MKHFCRKIVVTFFALSILFLTSIITGFAEDIIPVAEPGEVTIYKDIQYKFVSESKPDQTSLDIYQPMGVVDAPVLVYIHGGIWIQGDKGNYDWKTHYFVERGWVVVSANYRLAPDITFPANAEDVGDAIAWVYQNIDKYGGDPNRIFIIGYSSGAHLVALVATDESYLNKFNLKLDIIKGIVLLESSYYDIFRRVVKQPYNKDLHNMIFGENPILWYKASPFRYVFPNKNIPPSLLVYTELNNRHQWQAIDFSEILNQNGYFSQTYFAADVDHVELNVQLGMPEDKTINVIMPFLEKYL